MKDNYEEIDYPKMLRANMKVECPRCHKGILVKDGKGDISYARSFHCSEHCGCMFTVG